MTDREYRLVFRGNTLPTIPVQAVKSHLAKLFSADEARIEGLFAGRPVIIKKGLRREEAERYRLRLEQAGALCEIVPTPGTGSADAARVANAGAAPPAYPPIGAERQPDPTSPTPDHHPSSRRMKNKERTRDTAGENSLSALEGITADLRSRLGKIGVLDGGHKRRLIRVGAAATVVVVIAAALMLGGSSRPMPVAPETFDKFAKRFYREIRPSDIAATDTRVLIDRAREVVEGMGFDFDRTLLLWLFRKELVESRGGSDIYRTILVEPVAVAVAAGLSGIEEQIAPETRRIFQTAAAIPPAVDLAAIRMIRGCPFDGHRLKHDDLLLVLQANDIPVDAGQPDLSIADAFFGLEQAGFIHIHRRWENDVQFSDVEVLAPEAMRLVEEQLVYLAEMKKDYGM